MHLLEVGLVLEGLAPSAVAPLVACFLAALLSVHAHPCEDRFIPDICLKSYDLNGPDISSPLPDVEQLEADLTRVLAPVLSSNLVFPIFGHSERRSRLEFVSDWLSIEDVGSNVGHKQEVPNASNSCFSSRTRQSGDCVVELKQSGVVLRNRIHLSHWHQSVSFPRKRNAFVERKSFCGGGFEFGSEVWIKVPM